LLPARGLHRSSASRVAPLLGPRDAVAAPRPRSYPIGDLRRRSFPASGDGGGGPGRPLLRLLPPAAAAAAGSRVPRPPLGSTVFQAFFIFNSVIVGFHRCSPAY